MGGLMRLINNTANSKQPDGPGDKSESSSFIIVVLCVVL